MVQVAGIASGKAHIESLATYFCARTKANSTPRACFRFDIGVGRRYGAVSGGKAILSGQVGWLEEGIIRYGSIETVWRLRRTGWSGLRLSVNGESRRTSDHGGENSTSPEADHNGVAGS